jgi:FkbM family methyltransferase
VGLQSKLNKLQRYVSYLGSRAGLTLALLELRDRQSKEIVVSPRGLTRPITLRSRSSDFETFVQVLGDREYDVPQLSEPKVIVDAGANIGLASRYFAERWPNAKIIALEPESSNFELLCRNVAGCPNVTPLKRALWKSSGSIELFDPGLDKWAFRANTDVAETGETWLGTPHSVGTTPCVSVADLMREYRLPRIDLLKVDIEGAEKEVFAASAEWIDKVEVVVVELHDRFKRGCAYSFYNATQDFAVEVHKGEHIFMFRSGPPPSAVAAE